METVEMEWDFLKIRTRKRIRQRPPPVHDPHDKNTEYCVTRVDLQTKATILDKTTDYTLLNNSCLMLQTKMHLCSLTNCPLAPKYNV